MHYMSVLLLAVPALTVPVQLPAGIDPVACPNYPTCDGRYSLPVPDVPGAAGVIRAQEDVILLQRGAPQVPGIAAHNAAESAVRQASRPGFQTHYAAEAAVLLAQGRAPANLNAGELAHFQAEAAVKAAEQQLVLAQG